MLTRRTLLGGAAGTALLASKGALAASAAGAPRVLPVQLAAILEEAVERGTPGLSAAVGTRRGVIWTGVAGMADVGAGQPIDEAHCFGVGSITKLFVAVVILQLVEEGRLSLAATPLTILGGRPMRGIANAEVATVAQLLGHTAGVPSWEDEPAWIRKGRGAGVEPSHVWGRSEALEFVRGHPPLFAPGERFSYSNSNFTILGMIIEKLTGNTAEFEIARRVLSPLKLSGTWLEGFEPGRPARLPRRYHYATPAFRDAAGTAAAFPEVRPGLVDVSASNLSAEWVAGGMVSSPADLVHFATALRDGVLLRPESLGFMRRWTPVRPDLSSGLSLFQFRHGRRPLDGHNGNVLGFTGSLWWAETGDAVLAVLANVGSMHSGITPPTAADVIQHSDFTTLALAFAAQHG